MGCAASVHASENSQCKDPKHKEYDNTIRAVTEQSRKESEEQPTKQPEKKEISLGPVKLFQEISRVLLVFPVEDGQSEAFMWACRKGGYPCSIANNMDMALEALEKSRHQIVVIDMRLPVFNAGEQLCRKIRSMNGINSMVMLAVCPAIPRWCEEPSVRPYLEMGFNRRFLENHDRGACLNEIIMLDQNAVQSGLKLSLANALFHMLEENKDSVDITDRDGICSYVNPAFERLTGFKRSDIISNSTATLIDEDKTGGEILDSIKRNKCEGKVWEGVVYNNRKGMEPLPVDTKILPVYDGNLHNNTVYYITSRRDGSLLPCKMCTKCQGYYGSRRMSNGRVRVESSNTSLNSVNFNTSRRISKQVDAPIIKIITMLRNIQESSPQLPSHVMDNIMSMLRSSELYNPGSTSLTEDPEAIGFMDGLMEFRNSFCGIGTEAYPASFDSLSSTRRSSNSSDHPSFTLTPLHPSSLTHQSFQGRGARPSITGDLLPSHRESSVGLNSTMVMPLKIKDNLSRRNQWDYDIFELEKLSQRRPLLYIGFDILVEFGILNLLKIDETLLHNWLNIIEAQYRTSNTYHNSTHAADVLQASAYFCRNSCMEKCLDPMDFLSLLIASICHDIDHPGRTNAFLCNVSHKLAVLYNDSAVLESHHAALTFKITCQNENKNINIFQNLDPDTFKLMRKSIISMILATDMTQHFDHYNKFLAIISPLNDADMDENPLSYPLSQEHKSLILRMAIKCADISNPSRSIELAREWAHRIVLEYRDQIAEETSKDLPASLPSFDDIPKSQVYFVRLFANDLLGAFYEFLEMDNLTDQLSDTFDYWDNFNNEDNPYPYTPGQKVT